MVYWTILPISKPTTTCIHRRTRHSRHYADWRGLENAGGGAIYVNAIRQHGSIPTVSTRLGLERLMLTNRLAYWDDFANIERELRLSSQNMAKKM